MTLRYYWFKGIPENTAFFQAGVYGVLGAAGSG
jgi:hypothetical protein